MEGGIFYWCFWAAWVYITFILGRRNPYRLKLAVIVLSVLAFSTSHFRIGTIQVAWSGVLLLLFSYSFLAQAKVRYILYYSFCSLIISIAYCSFHLFEVFDPVWLLFKKEWMISICICYLTILLQKNISHRLVIAVSGTIQGDCLTAFIFNKLHISYAVAALSYLDICSLIMMLIGCWSLLEKAGVLLHHHLPTLDRNKHKSS
ncbi:YphA family membrane protein [Bacillus rubiinfantis]|uniref:YphA family membrane protein n=1 Tax=Bacillus rubiinfantis TaxID=1499680 RepID=UPI0005A99D34|nr:hypothetical protein [Bacillus rubiinfantis]